MEIPVFRNGQWISYTPPQELPVGWSQTHSFQAASIFATAQSRGYSTRDSDAFAEMFIFKQIFDGLIYDSRLEKELDQLLISRKEH
jgi:hypothetical protein